MKLVIRVIYTTLDLLLGFLYSMVVDLSPVAEESDKHFIDTMVKDSHDGFLMFYHLIHHSLYY